MNFKKFFPLICLIITVLSLNAQEFGADISSSNLKIGIYKNYEEFKNNAPSIKFDYNILEKQINTGGYIKDQKTTFYYLDIDKASAKEIGKVYGFSDGKNIFINEFNPRLKPKTLFMRVGFVANYCIFEYKTFDKYLDSLPAKNKVIDMETGTTRYVTKTRLKKLVSDQRKYVVYNNMHKANSSGVGK